MITCMLHIRVQPGYEKQAVDVLSAIEREARQDAGMLNFSWLQNEADPDAYTLVEQWETQEDLDQHLKADPLRWERFTPCLATEPQSENYRAVSDLAAPPSPEEIRDLVATWFARLSAREPAGDLLALVDTGQMVMKFPEDVLTDEAQFRHWYDAVGQAFHDQSHDLESLEVTEDPGEAAADVELAVIWKTHRNDDGPDGPEYGYRAHQAWRIVRSPRTGVPLIARYQVKDLVPVSGPEAGAGAA